MKKILVVGLGYVGLSNGLILAKNNEVLGIDTNEKVIESLKKKVPHIDDDSAKVELKKTSMKFSSGEINYSWFDFIILALPTNFDEKTGKFDTSILDAEISKIAGMNLESVVIIKSTIPIGYTKSVMDKFKNLKIAFSPEFLREGSSYNDALNPTRIIVSGYSAKEISEIFKKSSSNEPECLITGTEEAESIKLFANTYLAMRVAFVNELSTFAMVNGLKETDIIKGISLDPRIGKHYLRPSLGYGGYCLPKDSKQLKSEFSASNIKSSLFDAIVISNEERKSFMAAQIIKSGVTNYTFDGLGHKPGVSNYRNSPVLDVAKKISKAGIKVLIKDDKFKGGVIEGIKII